MRVAIEAIGSKKVMAVVEQDQRVVLMRFVQLQLQAKGLLSINLLVGGAEHDQPQEH